MRRRFWDKLGLLLFYIMALAVMIYVALLVVDFFTVNTPNANEWHR